MFYEGAVPSQTNHVRVANVVDGIGIITVAYGDNAHRQARLLARSIRNVADVPLCAISDIPTDYAQWLQFPDYEDGARWAKLNMNELTPFEQTIYMDADTVMQADIVTPIRAILADYDFAIAPSTAQDTRRFQHIRNEAEKSDTYQHLQNWQPLQLQAGVLAFNKCAVVDKLFSFWRAEWVRYQEQDQAALLRALDSMPEKPSIWLLSNEFNGGVLVQHNFGRARRR